MWVRALSALSGRYLKTIEGIWSTPALSLGLSSDINLFTSTIFVGVRNIEEGFDGDK